MRTSALARMNMILHDNATAKIWKGNTLADPHWKDSNDNLKTFDFAVANPPFPTKTGPAGWMLRTILLTVLSGVHHQKRMVIMLSCCTSSRA
ncbi:type I restriction-modification system, M subunit [Salmonella enterica subsp. enterica]|uniref:site-specific DNA-methyltransferase (adenine-specific) n=1 Tax=Salmonella enterica I TaxID=59201 RepID=A0A3S4FAA4_SALET|nr:type I restriction-modification system, M subunit [Salmonella enterica subsp. enterica]